MEIPLKFSGNSTENSVDLPSEIPRNLHPLSDVYHLKLPRDMHGFQQIYHLKQALFSGYYPLIICLFSDYYSLNIHLFSNAIMNNVKNILIKNTELHQIPHETRPEQDDSVTYLGQGQVVDRGG